MKTFATITEATLETIGRKRKRNEVEHGITMAEIGGLKVVESVRMLHANRADGLNQSISKDYKTIKVKNDKLFDYAHNYLLEEPIKYYIGGDFEAETMIRKRIKTRTGSYTYTTAPAKTTHKVLFAEYIITDFEENDDGSFNMELQMIE